MRPIRPIRPIPPTPEVAALHTRIDIMRRNLEHAHARATLLEKRSRGLTTTIAELATQLEATRAQLAAARDLIDRRTVSLRMAEEAWSEEAQRVIDLEGEAALWLSRQVKPVGVLQSN